MVYYCDNDNSIYIGIPYIHLECDNCDICVVEIIIGGFVILEIFCSFEGFHKISSYGTLILPQSCFLWCELVLDAFVHADVRSFFLKFSKPDSHRLAHVPAPTPKEPGLGLLLFLRSPRG